MTFRWQRCPHCTVYFALEEGGGPDSPCLACGRTAALNAEPPVAGCGFDSRHTVLSEAQVVPEAENCVQCGCCTYNCPMGIDVRAHAWRGRPIRDSHCLTCSECVRRCPRGVLRFERIPLFAAK